MTSELWRSTLRRRNKITQTTICEIDQHTVRKTPELPELFPRKLSNLLPAAWLCSKHVTKRSQISLCKCTQSCRQPMAVVEAPVLGNQTLRHAQQRKHTCMGRNALQRENQQKKTEQESVWISMKNVGFADYAVIILAKSYNVPVNWPIKHCVDFRGRLVDSADDGSSWRGKGLQAVNHALRHKRVQTRRRLIHKKQWRIGQHLHTERLTSNRDSENRSIDSDQMSDHSTFYQLQLQQTISVMTPYSLREHPSLPFLDQTLCEHSGGLVGRAAK